CDVAMQTNPRGLDMPPRNHTEPVLTVVQAAEACAVSVDTIRRRLRAGGFPRARREVEPNGAWLIPFGDLAYGGLAADRARLPGNPRPVTGADLESIEEL